MKKVPVLIPFLVLVSAFFIGILIWAYVETRKANPQMIEVGCSIELLKPGGTVLIIGIPEIDRVSFSIHTLRRKEIQLQSVRRQNQCMAPAIELAASGAIKLDQIVTHHFPLAETKQAFDLVADYRDGVVKAIVHVAD